jgi:PAS domain S-box-containing protein
VLGRTSRTGQPQWVTNVEDDPDFFADVSNITSEVCVPLKRGDEVLGVLNVESDDTDRPLDASDLQLLTLLSNHIVIALENARLYESVERELAERKAAEEALRVSEERFVLAMRATNDGIYDHDIVNDTIYWSPRLKEILGYADNELDIDLDTFGKFLHPDDREHVMVALEAHLKDRVPFDVEERLRTKSGEYRWFRFRGQAVWDEDGRPTRIVGSGTDITELKQAEEALKKAYEEVEKQVEERTAELEREIAERERLQQEIIETQKRALQELSTPIIPVMDRIIVMPLIGSIDTLRAKDIMRALLAGIREHRAKVVILDITGVPIVDSGVANHLNKTIQAARLKGAQTIVTGISDAVAEAVVDLGIDWSGVETLADLQTGLRVALAKMGRHIEG